MQQVEIVVWGRKEGQDAIDEQILLTHGERVNNLKDIMARMTADGWITRIQRIDLNAKADFASDFIKSLRV